MLLVQYHDVQIEPTEKAVKRALGKLGEEAFFQLLALKRADNLAQSPEYRGRLALCDQLEAIAREILRREDCFSLRAFTSLSGGVVQDGSLRSGSHGALAFPRRFQQVPPNQNSPRFFCNCRR